MSTTTSTTTSAPVRVPPPEVPGLNGLLLLAVFVVTVAALALAREVLIPIVLAGLLSFLLAPVASLLDRVRVPHVISVLLAVMLALGIITSVGGLIGVQVAGLANDAPRYESTVERKLTSIREATVGRATTLIQTFGRQYQDATAPRPPAAPSAGRAPEPDGGSPGSTAPPGAAPTGAAKPMQVQVEQPNPTPLDLAMRILGPVVGPLSTVIIVLIVAVFMLLQREDLRDRAIRLFGSGDLHRSTMAMNDAARRLSRYFLLQFGINAAFGIIIGCGLAIIGVPSPALWGILGALLRFVPYVGAWLAAALPAVLAAAVDPGWSMLAWTGALYGVTEFTFGQVVEPMLYGHSTGLSPFAVVVAATFWTWLWGPIGLILSTPLTLCLVVLGRHVERLAFLEVLLGDRPALSPVESLYQRLLAGDPDEAHAQAEVLLRERPLSAYYDEVAVKGLQLAAADAGRGVLAERQLLRVCKAARHLIDDLRTHEDVSPKPSGEADPREEESRQERSVPNPPAPEGAIDPANLPEAWRGEAPVLCLAGRGPLDDEAALILAQLLEKHGLHTRVLEHEAASRDAVGKLDLTGVAIVCICYLELTGVPSHLRYLIRRLRERLPKNTPILVGLWRAEEDVLSDDELRSTLGADLTVGTLRDAVSACIAAATPAPAKADAKTPVRAAA